MAALIHDSLFTACTPAGGHKGRPYDITGGLVRYQRRHEGMPPYRVRQKIAVHPVGARIARPCRASGSGTGGRWGFQPTNSARQRS